MTSLQTLLKKIKKCYQEIDLRKEKAPKEIERAVKKIIFKLKKKKLFLAPFESCTGGALINAITNVEGASEITKGSRVAYSDEDKISLGIPKSLIKKYTVYSPYVACAMAYQAIKEIKGSQIGIGITGLLTRKDPRYPEKKPNIIDIACLFKNRILVRRFLFPKLKRPELKTMAVKQALEMIDQMV